MIEMIQPASPFIVLMFSQLLIMDKKCNFTLLYEPPYGKTNSNYEADQRLCFRCTDSTIPLLSKSKVYSHKLSYVIVQPGLCWTCSETTLLFSHEAAHMLARIDNFLQIVLAL